MSNGTSSVAPPGRCTPPPAIRRMLCQVEGPLHRLAVDRRQTAAGVRDRPYQAGAGHRAPVRYAFHPVVARSSSRSVRWANQPFCTQPPRTRACAAAMNIRIWCSSASCAAARSRRARSRRSRRCRVQPDSPFCAVRGGSSSVVVERASLGPTIREPHRLGFGLVGSDSAVAAVGDCSASCYAPLGRLSFNAVSSRHPVGVGW